MDARYVWFAYELPVCQYQEIEQNASVLFRSLDNSDLKKMRAELVIELISLEAEQLRRKKEYDNLLKDIGKGSAEGKECTA